MKKYTCIIVDDERLALDLITRHIAKIPQLELVASCQNAIETRFALEQQQPDLLFLDINLPNLSGLELLRMLNRRPATILTTAYSEYALVGYELDVIDYLLKPIEFERLFKAVSKAIDWMSRGANHLQPTATVVESVEVPDYFFVKSDFKTVKVIFAEILFIEALQKYVRIHTTSERIITLISMSQLESTLPERQFVRVHRSYIVNLDRIESIDGNTIQIEQHLLPISKGQREHFMDLIRLKSIGRS